MASLRRLAISTAQQVLEVTRLDSPVRKAGSILQTLATKPALAPPPPVPTIRSPWDSTEEDQARWDREWLHYLSREWRTQLDPYDRYPQTPPLPETAEQMLDLRFGHGPSLQVYVDPKFIEGARVVELGCGCGNMGKGRVYADFYWPAEGVEQAVVLSPDDPLSARHPSATFRYETSDVEGLLVGRPYRILRTEIVPRMQRRYVVIERT